MISWKLRGASAGMGGVRFRVGALVGSGGGGVNQARQKAAVKRT